jgi:hypothetical protein
VLFALGVAFLEKRKNLCSASHRHQGMKSSSKAIAIEKRIDMSLCQASFFYFVDQLYFTESREVAS